MQLGPRCLIGRWGISAFLMFQMLSKTRTPLHVNYIVRDYIYSTTSSWVKPIKMKQGLSMEIAQVLPYSKERTFAVVDFVHVRSLIRSSMDHQVF